MRKEIKYINVCIVLLALLSIDVTAQIKPQCGFDALLKNRRVAGSGNRSTAINYCTQNGASSTNVFQGYGPSAGNIISLPEGKINYPVKLIRIEGLIYGSNWSHTKINQVFQAVKEYYSETLNINFVKQGEIKGLTNADLLSLDLDNEISLVENWESSNFSQSNNPMLIYFTNQLIRNNEPINGSSLLPCHDNQTFQNLIGNQTFISHQIIDDGTLNDAVSTLIHEIGHHFGLFHTFEKNIFGEDNYNTNSNVNGDAISDTPGTPFNTVECCERTSNSCNNLGSCMYRNFQPHCNVFPIQCSYLTETNGQKLFINYMSYAVPGACRQELTPLQLKKIQDVLLTGGRGDICIKPGKPAISVQGNINSISLGSSLVFTSQLNSQTGSNTNNVAKWGIKDLEIEYSGNTFTVTTGSNGLIQSPGNYTIFAVDVPRYNANCHSDTTFYSLSVGNNPENGYACFDIVYADFSYQCGPTILYETTARQFRYGGRVCSAPPTVVTNNPIGNNGNNGNNNGPGDPGGPGNGNNGTVISGVNIPPVTTKNEDCRECLDLLLKKLNKAILNNQNGGN